MANQEYAGRMGAGPEDGALKGPGPLKDARDSHCAFRRAAPAAEVSYRRRQWRQDDAGSFRPTTCR
jgi:hypothetical protein